MNQNNLQYQVRNLSIEFTTIRQGENNYDRFIRDLDRMKWFTIGFGYEQSENYWTGLYQLEEMNSVIRYLDRFGWQKIKEAI